jgi:hypothetical protein
MALVDINWKPTDRDLRIFTGLQWAFFGVMAWIAWHHHGWVALAGLIVAASTLLAIAGLVAPQRIRPVYVGWMLAVFPIGWMVSHVVFAAVYYLVFTPIGWVLRSAGHDPMKRQWDRTAMTYWKRRGEAPEAKRYFRQF